MVLERCLERRETLHLLALLLPIRCELQDPWLKVMPTKVQQ